jgi:hypothetical protein
VTDTAQVGNAETVSGPGGRIVRTAAECPSPLEVPMTSRTDLPIPDFDSAQLGSLQPRLRGLDRDQVEVLLSYERGHANRTAFVEHLEQRLHQLDDGAVPTGGGDPRTPAAPPVDPVQAGSPVSPQTAGPPVNPPTGGDPTNPAQPRS